VRDPALAMRLHIACTLAMTGPRSWLVATASLFCPPKHVSLVATLNRPAFREAPFLERMERWNTEQVFSEVRERAVRMVLEHQHEHGSQWAAMESIAGKIGCTAETLRKWVRRAERDSGLRPV